jgi:hypothetical protein
MKQTFKREYLRGEIGLPWDCEGGEIVSDTMIDHGRWTIEHEIVFRLPCQKPGEAWRANYRVGATETQDERPWEYDKEVECTLVQAVEQIVTVTVWEPVP